MQQTSFSIHLWEVPEEWAYGRGNSMKRADLKSEPVFQEKGHPSCWAVQRDRALSAALWAGAAADPKPSQSNSDKPQELWGKSTVQETTPSATHSTYNTTTWENPQSSDKSVLLIHLFHIPADSSVTCGYCIFLRPRLQSLWAKALLIVKMKHRQIIKSSHVGWSDSAAGSLKAALYAISLLLKSKNLVILIDKFNYLSRKYS